MVPSQETSRSAGDPDRPVAPPVGRVQPAAPGGVEISRRGHRVPRASPLPAGPRGTYLHAATPASFRCHRPPPRPVGPLNFPEPVFPRGLALAEHRRRPRRRTPSKSQLRGNIYRTVSKPPANPTLASAGCWPISQARDLREGKGGAKSEAEERTPYGPSCISPREDDGAAKEGRGEGPPNCIYPCDDPHRTGSLLVSELAPLGHRWEPTLPREFLQPRVRGAMDSRAWESEAVRSAAPFSSASSATGRWTEPVRFSARWTRATGTPDRPARLRSSCSTRPWAMARPGRRRPTPWTGAGPRLSAAGRPPVRPRSRQSFPASAHPVDRAALGVRTGRRRRALKLLAARLFVGPPRSRS
jgi:hypothetical protein